MKIAVFCSANAHIDSDYFRLTEEMGKWMAEQGHDLVFGGCNIGLMNTIGYHSKKVILYNMKGFWNSTIALLDDMASQGMIRGNWHDYIEVATSLSELQQMVER